MGGGGRVVGAGGRAGGQAWAWQVAGGLPLRCADLAHRLGPFRVPGLGQDGLGVHKYGDGDVGEQEEDDQGIEELRHGCNFALIAISYEWLR